MTAETTGHPIRQTGTESRRDPAIDALRGLALMGILIVNLPFFAMPYGFAGSWWMSRSQLWASVVGVPTFITSILYQCNERVATRVSFHVHVCAGRACAC